MITGAVKVIDLPEDAGVVTAKELIKSLERYLAVEFEVEQITNVVVSPSEPDVSERNVIWEKLDNSGNFVGRFNFIQGKWIQTFPVPNGIYKHYGNSNEIPEGYALYDETLPGVTAAMAAHRQSTWLLEPGGNYFVEFDIVYVGL